MRYTSLTINQLTHATAPGCSKTIVPEEQLPFNDWAKYIKEQLLVVMQGGPMIRDNRKGRKYMNKSTR